MRPFAVSIKDAQKLLGLGRTKIFQMIKEHEIKAYKVGRRTLIQFDSLEQFANRMLEGSSRAN